MRRGDVVRFDGASKEQIRWGSNTDPKDILRAGNFYEIESVEVHSWHTKISLKGIDGQFNSASFTEEARA